eukprot:TRINITY_DN64755_c0_g1_i3.p1 TRINITY_DN64755_c0_g1~~TRINITY_DN64755_c0_g1_i3.p1  ORF type:complete len:446 (-),score=59.99 TRINITY_DN64755_c0_g1_i3:1426-2763(-)
MLFCRGCCELVHQGKMRQHVVNTLDVSVQKQLPYCITPGHEEYRCDLFCQDTNEFICLLCQAEQHRHHQCFPTIKAAHLAKEELSEWIAHTNTRKGKLKAVVKSMDIVMDTIEKRAEDELMNLDELLNALIDKLEQQAKMVSDKIVENKIQEINKLCRVRKEIVTTIANMNDDLARVERAINQSDAVELILCNVEVVKQPPPLTIHLPQYTLPVVGPDQELGQCFSVDFLPSQDPVFLDPVFQDIVIPPPVEDLHPEKIMPPDGVTRIGTGVSADYEWALDVLEKGDFITVSTNSLIATTNCNDVYEQSAILGNVAMDHSVWYWKVKMLNLVGSKQVCFGVTRKPFDHTNPKPYKCMWGWSSNGCALPSYETRNAEAKVHSGDEVWLKLDCDLGRIEAYWPATGMSGNIDIGVKAQGKQLYPVFVLARRGNTVQTEPVKYWEIQD